MSQNTAEQELLIAVKAVEEQLISAEELKNAIADWNPQEARPLRWFLINSAADDARGKQIGQLFEDHSESLASELLESIEDSLFGKLNSALAKVGNEDVQASIAKWPKRTEEAEHAEQSIADGPRSSISESDRFDIICEHARGGLGEVLLADDRQLNRRVALKRIREKWADNEHARIRFQQEAEITGRLEHPGVVPVYALGKRADGQIFYAMRFIRGESLEAASEAYHSAAESEGLDLRSAEFRNLLRRFVDVCNTMSYAHSRGIMHRDLKPANIMLGKYGETLVVDWGLAKQIGTIENHDENAESIIISDSGSGSAPTQFGSALGTPQYMSPEQATGRLDRMGPATDVFGLGATLYHVLTNHPPQQKDSVDNILERVEYGEFPRPSEVNASVPKPLEAICMKALAVRPSDRYETPMHLGEDLERWLADEPVTVCQDSVPARMTRWVRKHQTLAVTTAVTMLLLTCGSVIGSFVWGQIKQQQFAFEQNEQRQKAREHEKEQVRLAQLETSLSAAETIVQQQLDENRFRLAVSVLESEIQTLADEPQFAEQRAVLQQKSQRLTRIADFYRIAQDAEADNYQSQDQDAIIGNVSALDLLNVWDHADWWNHLPHQDLSVEQHENLKQAAYKQLVLLASTYVKLMGTKTLAGPDGKLADSFSSRMGAILSQSGKDEARATIIICNLASRFQQAESLRWYRGMAGMRMLKPTAVPARKLSDPRNAADAYALGLLSLIRAVGTDLPFHSYRDTDDALTCARETFGIASEMDPSHYWTHIALAQTEYLTAEQAVEAGDPEAWRLYDAVRRTYGRCVALAPEQPFAYADLSTATLRQKEMTSASQILSDKDKLRIQKDLLESCLSNARTAVQYAPEAPWVYWHYGHALAASDQIDEAMEAYMQAIELGYRFSINNDALLVDEDRIRGRSRMIEDTQERIANGDHRSILNAVTAAAWLTINEDTKAEQFAIAACEADIVHPFALATRGLLAMKADKDTEAISWFRRCQAENPASVWAAIGLGLCHERQGAYDAAAKAFEKAKDVAVTKYHQSDAVIGLCRMAIRRGNVATANDLLREARRVDPACSLGTVAMLAEELNQPLVLQTIESLRPISTSDIVNNEAILDTQGVPVHNGDFELPLDRGWHNPKGPVGVAGSGESSATIDRREFHGGASSLHLHFRKSRNKTTTQTRQTVTVDEDSNYKISLWAKSATAAKDSVSISLAAENAEAIAPTVTLPSGSYDWQQLEARFETPKSRRYKGLAPMTIQLQVTDVADVWIDDITITRLPEVNGE